MMASRLLFLLDVKGSRLPLKARVIGPRLLFKSVNQAMGIVEVSGAQVFPCYMSTSGKPPDWPNESTMMDDKSKGSKMDFNHSDGRIDSSSSGKIKTLDSGKVDSFSSGTVESFSSGRMDSISDLKMDTSGSGKINNSGNGRMDRWMNYLQEKRPEVYTLGQKLSEKSVSLKNSVTAATVSKTQGDKKPEDWNDILNRWYQQYQDFVGITDLKKAQDRVTELSETLLETQGRRRALQAETEDLQERLVINHQRITKTEQYSQEHFTLFDQAREMNDRLKIVRAEFSQCERTERDTFTQLSAAIRDCHERERMQAEQSKYWSIIASVVSAALASIITSVNNWVRIREIKDHVTSNNKSLLDGYKQMHQDVMEAVASTEAIVNEAGNAIKRETGQVASVSGVPDPGHSVSEEGVTSGKSAPDSGLITRHSTVSLAAEELSRISRELLREISETLAKDRDIMRELMVEELGKVVSGLAGGGELTREAIGGTVLDLQTHDHREVKTGATHDIDKLSSPHDVTLETAQALGSAIALDSAIPGSSEEGKKTSEYTYRHIASAMAVGAGIGTLATACIMRSLGGG